MAQNNVEEVITRVHYRWRVIIKRYIEIPLNGVSQVQCLKFVISSDMLIIMHVCTSYWWGGGGGVGVGGGGGGGGGER